MPEPLDIGATDLAAEAVDGRLVGRAVADSERTIAVGEAIKNPTQPGGKALGVLTHEFGVDLAKGDELAASAHLAGGEPAIRSERLPRSP